MGELDFAVVLLAIALTIMGYDHLQQKQPEYPNKRLIAVFTLAGGLLGASLLLLIDLRTIWAAGMV